jgi:lipoprotein-anchoring transpeptidase ErfK/SrfK
MISAGVLGAALAGAALAVAAPATAGDAAPSATGVEIARLVVSAPVRVRPTAQSPLRGKIAAVRPLTGQQTAIPVLEEATDAHGGEWLRVRLPGRPSGRVGWIAATNAHLVHSAWWVVVDRSARQVRVYRNGKLRHRFLVVIGAVATPTPRGHYFVVEHVPQRAGSMLGPWALATSAFSHVLQEFDGGPGQIALHGRSGPLAGDPLGTAASHGCIRFDNDVIQRLAGLLPNGTPIDVV